MSTHIAIRAKNFPGGAPESVARAARAMTVASTGARTRIPRDSEDDYTSAAAAERRAFVEAETGAKLDHVGRYAFDPEILRGNIENFTGKGEQGLQEHIPQNRTNHGRQQMR